jgi:ATP-binding cassette subfamily C protein LapB
MNMEPQFQRRSDYEIPLQEALIVLLKQHGVASNLDHLMSGLPVVNSELPVDLLDRALNRYQYKAKWRSTKPLNLKTFPACVALASGYYAVVVGREGDGFLVLDGETPDIVHTIRISTFDTARAQQVLHIFPTVDLLLKRHAPPHTKGHWFWGRLFAQKAFLLDIFTASLVANILAIMVSLFALQVYDRVIPGQAEVTLWVLAGGVTIAIFFEAVLRIARARLIDGLGKDSEIDITSDLFSRVLHMKIDKRPATPGGIVHMLREFGAVKEFFTTAAVGVVADLPFVFVFLALVYAIAGNVVFILMAGALLILIPSFAVQKKMAKLAEENMGGTLAASRLLTEAAYGLESLKANRSEPYFQKQWEEIIALNAIKTTQQRALGSFLSFWATSMQQFTYVCAVIACVYMVFANELSVGAIIAVGILSTRSLSPITQLSQIMSRWQNMKTALRGLDALVSAEVDNDTQAEQDQVRRDRLGGAYLFQNVKYLHPGSKSVGLKINRYEIKPGDRVALMGPNGSGKSTLLRLFAGLLEAQEGEVLLDGLDVRQINGNDLRRNIGYLPQEIVMFRGTLRDNLSQSGAAFSDEDFFEALEFSGLEEFVKQHREVLGLNISDGGQGLSIGQRQSIGIARLFLQDPSIILMDEPTSALDQTLEMEIVQRLGAWIGNRTCIIATHRPLILSQLKKITMLNQGQIVISGKRDAVLKKLNKGSQTEPQKQIHANVDT